MTNRYDELSDRARWFMENFDELDIAELCASKEAANARVISLYERWVKAGPPPLGTSMSRWWDMRLAELHNAILNQPTERAPHDGPTVAEAAADDRRWPLQKNGE